MFGRFIFFCLLCLPFCAQAQDSVWSAEASAQGRSFEQGRSARWQLSQMKKLTAALAAVRPQTPGVIDAFVLSVALDSDAVFGREAAETARVLSRRFGAIGRTVILAAGDGAGLAAAASGSPDTLGIALAGIAARMNGAEDVLILFVTSHGSPNLGLNYRDGANGMGLVGPERLKALLEEVGIKNRLVLVSACYSGSFVPALQNDTSIILTAAAEDRPSFGCNAGNDWTFFGDALVNTALRKPQPLDRAVVEAYGLIGSWERDKRLDSSGPQSWFGVRSSAWLTVLEKRMPAVASAKTGKPAIGDPDPVAANLPIGWTDE